ncbi:MAG: hypothetical protein ACR2QM_04335, partial [Longimicrobiales bacterium]
MNRYRSIGALALGSAILLTACPDAPSRARAGGVETGGVEWPNYGNDAGGTKFSPLDQIDRSNVSNLEVAWTSRSGDFPPEMFEAQVHGEDPDLPEDPRAGGPCSQCHGTEVKFETTPLMRDGALLLSTPINRVLALDPETGGERWAFDPSVDQDRGSSEGLISRGVAAWDDPDRPSAACGRRVYVTTIDARLVSLDAETGVPCEGFGDGGTVDLTQGVAINGRQVDLGDYLSTSPPAVVNGLLVVGSAIGDNRRKDVESGV